MSSIRVNTRRQFPLVPIVILALLLGFFAVILLTWEAPAPLARVEKVLPASALDGGRSPVGSDGLSAPTIRFVGPLAQPLESEAQATDQAVQAAPAPQIENGLDLTGGLIVIDGRGGN